MVALNNTISVVYECFRYQCRNVEGTHAYVVLDIGYSSCRLSYVLVSNNSLDIKYHKDSKQVNGQLVDKAAMTLLEGNLAPRDRCSTWLKLQKDKCVFSDTSDLLYEW